MSHHLIRRRGIINTFVYYLYHSSTATRMGSVRSCSSLQDLKLGTPIGPVRVTACGLGIHEINLTPSDRAPCGKLE